MLTPERMELTFNPTRAEGNLLGIVGPVGAIRASSPIENSNAQFHTAPQEQACEKPKHR
jgi:hypothetical protein